MFEGRQLQRRRLRPTVMVLEDRHMLSTFQVTSTYDNGSTGTLRWAVAQANAATSASTIDFNITTPATITLSSGVLELSNTSAPTTIDGPGADLLSISGNNASRVFQVDASVTASISGLTITKGGVSGAGAGLANFGTTTLSNCTISGNSAVNGGGLYTSEYGTTTLSNCTVSGNSAYGNGGGLYDYLGTTMLTNCTISGNSAGGDGGGLNNFVGTAILNNCTISGNSAVNGGGISTFFGTNTLTNCSFSGNLASENGGGLNNYGATTSLTNCSFSGDSASENGGGLENLFYGTTTLYKCSFSGNVASENGGGLNNKASTTTLAYCSFSGDSASENGGGLYNLNGTTTLNNVDVSGNSAIIGGGLDNYGGTSTLTNCTVSGNSATSGGGVGTDSFGTSTLTNCTVSGNSAVIGGGLETDDYGTTMLTNCTVSGNSAVIGGGLSNGDGTVTIGNTIVAENTADTSGPDGLGTFASLGNNLIGETDDSTGWVGSDLTGTIAQPLNPLLAPLGNYVGTTQTMALLPGSPAIDAGNNALIPAGVTTDQRGLARIVNGVVDIGAFESSQFTITVTSGNDQSTGIFTAFPAPLVATVTANNPSEPVAGGLVNFTPPPSGASATITGSPATISADGTVSVAATANGLVGGYTVSAGARGIQNTASFSLINQAIPTITTTPSMTTVTLGTSSVTLKDTALLSDGYYETGSITFMLYLGNTLVDTETTSVNGDGTYTTPTGYTLPTTGTVTGTYQWDSSYPGDTYNTSATENNVAAEQVAVSPAIPTITTTPNMTTVVLGTSAVTLKDTAVLSCGYHESGSITFTLYLGSTLVDTETVSVTGNGTYTTPTGYTLPTTGTVTGTYQWDSTYNGDTNNTSASENNVAAEQTVVSPASPTITTTPNMTTVTLGTSSVTLKDTATLSGGYYESGSITFTLYLGNTLVDTETMSVSGNGSYTTPTGYTLPTTGTVTGTYQWDSSYSGDTNNTSASENNVAGEQVVVSSANPTITTTPSVTTVVLGTSSVTLKDTALLSCGYHETGSITFTLFLGSTLVDTETVSVTGNGTYTTPSGYTLPTTGTVTGTYQWDSSYNGNTNNNAASENNVAAEQVVVSPASPTITTTPNMTAVTLGTSSVTLKDTATLSGGYYETGSITFTLYRGGTLVNTETMSINGNGTYTTPTGYTLPTTGTVTGTYQWDSSYNGDTNNTSASENNVAGEQVVVSPASPTITTTPNMTAVTLGTSSVTLRDTATLSGGYYETGSIAFTLYLGGTLVDTETVSVAGNGTYTTPTGYTLPTTGTVAGTYQWDSTYNGDTNNNAISENGVAAERVTVSQANPAIATTPSLTTVTLGTSSVTLKDTAAFSGGYFPAGTITFTLYLGSIKVDTETATVNGNGSYTTPTGYTLPTSGTVTGTYQWDSSYNGNTNNNAVSENNAPNEQVVVNPANPSLTTTPGGTIPIGDITINGTKYLDLTGNGFTSDDTPQAGVTIDLYQVTSGTQTFVASTTTGANGTYSFTVSAPGTYDVQESVPSGYIQTGGGPCGSAGNTYYTIVAAAGHSYSGYNFDDYLIPTCTPTNVSYKVTTPSGCSQSVTNLAGNTQQGDTVTVTFTVPTGMNDQLTLLSYIAPGSSFSDSTAYEQVIYQQATGTFAPGTHSLTVQIPNSYYQIDFVCGPPIDQLEPSQNNDAYGPDSANILYHAEDRFISSDNSGTTAPKPMPTPSPSPTTPAPTSSRHEHDPDRLGDPLWRVQPGWHDHLLPVRAGDHPQRHRQQQRLQRHGRGQRQWHLHHGYRDQSGRLRPDGGGHLRVGGGLRRRRQQQRSHERLRQRARDGQQGQPGHEYDTRRLRDVRRPRQADRHGGALGRVQPNRHNHLLPVRAGDHPQRHRQQQRLQRSGHRQRRWHV